MNSVRAKKISSQEGEPMKLKQILVTTDFSDLSRQAFPAAAALARKFQAQLHLVHVLEPLPPLLFVNSEGAQTYSPERDYGLKFRALLERTAEEEGSFRGLGVKTHLLEGGSIHERLVRFQEEERIDLSVLSTHGRSGLGHLFLGSFAEKAVRLSVSPVLTYKPGPGAAAGEPFVPRTILVPYDFSTNARAVLAAVRLFSDSFEPQTVFLHVLEPQADFSLLAGGEAGTLPRGADSAETPRTVQKELQGFLRKEFPGKEHFQAVARFGNPFLEILRLAHERSADLIVMTTHGWTGLKHALLGSVTEKVVRHAPCSVLTLRPLGLGFEEP
jgi:nucleotide-binding universal stress UspA family protein